jgi:hypothetical protein
MQSMHAPRPTMEGELMRQVTTRLMGTCAALVLGATLATAQTDSSRTTIVTFSAPVVLPGVTLPAGSYMFKLADSQTNRNIVQVFDKDRSKIFATILAIPAQRQKPADETVITFREAPANAAPAVQYWYYPGETQGQEFAYPKKQAMAIANAAHTSVLAVDMDSENYDAMKAGDVSRVEPGAEMAQTQPAAQSQVTETTPAQSAQPATPPSDMPTAKPEQAQPPATDRAPAAQPSAADNQPVGTSGTAKAEMPAGHMAHGVGTSGSLPHTASPLPLIGFAGLLALFGAAGVRAVRRASIN